MNSVTFADLSPTPYFSANDLYEPLPASYSFTSPIFISTEYFALATEKSSQSRLWIFPWSTLGGSYHFSSERRLVLGQLACEEKSNELTAIPKLLEMLDVEGCIITIDAMGTQTEIAQKITDRKADYILAVKANQPTLYEDIQLYMDDYVRTPGIQKTACYAKTMEKGHGRIEKRECFISEDIAWLDSRNRWSNLRGIGVIRCETKQNNRISTQNHYIIYSCKNMTAWQVMRYKREHWGIENGLHWILDMQFREDESRARKDNSAENLNVLRHMAYNILKSETTCKGSFTDKQFKCLLDETYLDGIVKLWCS